MALSLKIVGGKYGGAELPIAAGSTVIGRDKDCAIRVVSGSVSRRHCRIDSRGDRAELTDLKSRNGTYVNGERVAGSVELSHGNELRVGAVVFSVEFRAPAAGSGQASGDEPGAADAAVRDTAAMDQSSCMSVVIANWLDASEEVVATIRPVILVIDQDEKTHESVRAALASMSPGAPSLDVKTARTAAAGNTAWLETQPAAVLIDRSLWLGPGGEALNEARRRRDVPVIMLDHFGSAETAVHARKLRAFDYLLKPLNPPDLQAMIRPLIQGPTMRTTASQVGGAVDPPPVDSELVGRSAAMQKVFKAIADVAASDAAVLIHGEAGTGKDLVAKAIFQHSPRIGGRLLEAWCRVDSAKKLDRELFGYEKGSFAGANRRRVGKFEEWPDATLVLHEIEALPYNTQLTLLKILREGIFTRIGGDEPVRTNVRVLAIANSDLEPLVEAGAFRRELYFILKSYAIHVPALRERADDIDLLTDYVVAEASHELGRPQPFVTDDARLALRSYGWPNNVRELRSVVREAVMKAADRLLASDLRFGQDGEAASATRSGGGGADGSTAEDDALSWEQYIEKHLHAGRGHLYAGCLGWMERRLLRRILDHTDGNRAKAAEILGFTMSGLEQKLGRHGIDPDDD
jgi:DNA-binding NtrC family response regulator